MDNRCIIFSRVSTEGQSFDEQTLRLRRLAEESGYPPDAHVMIEYKESGIRLREEERLGHLARFRGRGTSFRCEMLAGGTWIEFKLDK